MADAEYRATLFVADEDGNRPFKHGEPFAASRVEDAKRRALDWAAEAKPAGYEAVELWLRSGETIVWKARTP